MTEPLTERVAERPAGSIARESFADAIAHVRSSTPKPIDRTIPLQYVVPSATGGVREPGVPTNGAKTSTPRGPLSIAVDGQRAGTTSSVELVERALEAIRVHDGELHSMVAVDADRARTDAMAADADRAAGRWRGPLHGVPLSVKDIIDVAGLPTRAGSAAFEKFPVIDAVAVTRLRAAGAIIVGKASTHEFALGVTNPQTRNPHDLDRIPGGSSGGSAVSIATGMALASLGTDTRASIRVPAALTGVVGFKPTFGVVPTTGVLSLSWTMDHVAPMAATVGDAAIVLDALLGRGPRLAGTGAARGLRIGLPAATFDDADPAVESVVREALRGLVESGSAETVPCARPTADDLERANAVGLVISRCEAATLHRALGLDRSLYWEEVGEQLALAEEVLAVDYLDAQRLRGEMAESLLACFDTADVLAMPTVPVVAPRVADFARYLMLLARNAIPWSLVGFPAISVPCGWAHGLPVGLQLVAPPHREDLLVSAGLAVESLTHR